MPQIQYLNVPRRANLCVSRRSKLGDLVFSQALHTFEQNVLKTTGSTVQDLLAAPAKVTHFARFTGTGAQMLTRSTRKKPRKQYTYETSADGSVAKHNLKVLTVLAVLVQ